jgi:hypothetical protein
MPIGHTPNELLVRTSKEHMLSIFHIEYPKGISGGRKLVRVMVGFDKIPCHIL